MKCLFFQVVLISTELYVVEEDGKCVSHRNDFVDCYVQAVDESLLKNHQLSCAPISYGQFSKHYKEKTCNFSAEAKKVSKFKKHEFLI